MVAYFASPGCAKHWDLFSAPNSLSHSLTGNPAQPPLWLVCLHTLVISIFIPVFCDMDLESWKARCPVCHYMTPSIYKMLHVLFDVVCHCSSPVPWVTIIPILQVRQLRLSEKGLAQNPSGWQKPQIQVLSHKSGQLGPYETSVHINL